MNLLTLYEILTWKSLKSVQCDWNNFMFDAKFQDNNTRWNVTETPDTLLSVSLLRFKCSPPLYTISNSYMILIEVSAMRFPGLNFKFLYDTTLIPRGRSKIVRCVCLFTRVYFWRQIQMGLATYKSKDSNQHGLNIFLSL